MKINLINITGQLDPGDGEGGQCQLGDSEPRVSPRWRLSSIFTSIKADSFGSKTNNFPFGMHVYRSRCYSGQLPRYSQ